MLIYACQNTLHNLNTDSERRKNHEAYINLYQEAIKPLCLFAAESHIIV